MAVSVACLYKKALPQYKMQLIAGVSGIDKLVRWVHSIEDKNVRCFLHGNEMVFTAGTKNNGECWPYNFA